MLAVLEEYDLKLVDDLLRQTAELFGITRLGANVRARLEAVYDKLPTEDDEVTTAEEPAPSEVAASAHPSDDPPDSEAEIGVVEIAAMLADAIQSSGTGGFDVNGGYIQWQGDREKGLYVEAGDGQGYDEPFDAALADKLVSNGWRRPVPKEDIRNCWFELPLALNGDESERSYAARLQAAAERVLNGIRVMDEHQR